MKNFLRVAVVVVIREWVRRFPGAAAAAHCFTFELIDSPDYYSHDGGGGRGCLLLKISARTKGSRGGRGVGECWRY